MGKESFISGQLASETLELGGSVRAVPNWMDSPCIRDTFLPEDAGLGTREADLPASCAEGACTEFWSDDKVDERRPFRRRRDMASPSEVSYDVGDCIRSVPKEDCEDDRIRSFPKTLGPAWKAELFCVLRGRGNEEEDTLPRSLKLDVDFVTGRSTNDLLLWFFLEAASEEMDRELMENGSVSVRLELGRTGFSLRGKGEGFGVAESPAERKRSSVLRTDIKDVLCERHGRRRLLDTEAVSSVLSDVRLLLFGVSGRRMRPSGVDGAVEVGIGGTSGTGGPVVLRSATPTSLTSGELQERVMAAARKGG